MNVSTKKEALLAIIGNYFQAVQKQLILQRQLYLKRKQQRRHLLIKKLMRKIEANFFLQRRTTSIILQELLVKIPKKRDRKSWVKTRSRQWWDSIVNNPKFDDQMIEAFRMDRESFKYICDKLKSELAGEAMCVREALSVDMVCAVSIYKLASCEEYHNVGNQFGISKSTVQKCIYKFCNAMIKLCLKEEIIMPSGDKAVDVINSFQEQCGVPLIMGVLDASHIPVTVPSIKHAEYINSKGWTSLNLQALVDSESRFVDISCKHPGSSVDAIALEDSFLYKNIEQLELPKYVINDQECGAVFIADEAYPLLPWLIKGYSEVVTEEQESFNAYLNSALSVAENAFRRLKGRFRMLLQRIKLNIDFVPKVVATTCILHNILERRNAPYKEEWNEEVKLANEKLLQPTSENTIVTDQGEEIRSQLSLYMSQNFALIKCIEK